MGAQPSPIAPLPAGLHITAPPPVIVRLFPLLADLQPVCLRTDGLICAPRSAPELAGPALERCPLPHRALATIPGWPDPPASWVAGWYRRSPDHAPAPGPVRELIQVSGEGFGPVGHATTAMCLELLELMPHGAAVDVGCGSGLLSQAWACLGRGPIRAIDLDPRAIDQAARSVAAAGLEGAVEWQRGPLESLGSGHLDQRILLANIPAAAHHALSRRLHEPPPGVVLSGIRPHQVAEVVAPYRAMGLRIVRARRTRRFCAVALTAPVDR